MNLTKKPHTKDQVSISVMESGHLDIVLNDFDTKMLVEDQQMIVTPDLNPIVDYSYLEVAEVCEKPIYEKSATSDYKVFDNLFVRDQKLQSKKKSEELIKNWKFKFKISIGKACKLGRVLGIWQIHSLWGSFCIMKSIKTWKFKLRSGYENDNVRLYSLVRCDACNECWLILGVDRLSKEEVQNIDWKYMEEKMFVHGFEAKESMKQRETSSQVYENMQEIFIVDKSTLAKTHIKLVRKLQDLKKAVMKKVDGGTDNKEENGFDPEKHRFASLTVRVQEHRMSSLLQSLRVGDVVRVMSAIKLIPTWGYFSYMAIDSLIGNQLFKLTVLLLVPSSKRFKVVEESHTSFLEKALYKSTATFTLLQVFNWGICYKVTWIPVAARVFRVGILARLNGVSTQLLPISDDAWMVWVLYWSFYSIIF